MARPTMEHVLAAIDALYHSQHLEGKEEASKWLDDFQHSVHAWEIADHLLQNNRDPETTYFAAQTMKTKIQHYFAELPIQQHLALRDSLLGHLTHYSLASHATMSQLCLALADLALACPQWRSPVTDLISKFTVKLEHFSILLEVLMILPEEVDRESLRLGANRRTELIDYLRESSEVVFKLLVKCHDICPADERSQCKLYQCFGSWLTLGCFPPKEVADSKLLKIAFETLLRPSTSPNLHEAITDCICSAAYIAGNMQTQLPLAEAMFSFVTSVLPPAFEAAVKEEDMDRAINYARIFTEMAESFLDAILTNPGQGAGDLATLDLVLSCVRHPSYEVTDITFNFWYRFAECVDRSYNCEQLLEIFRPYIQRLIIHLWEHCQLEPTQEGVIDRGDEFQEFRLRVLDVVHDVVFLVGSIQCFQQIYDSILAAQGDWCKVEAGFFMMNPVARFINSEVKLPGLLYQMILNLPPTSHIQVRHTATVLAGDLSHWIIENQEYLNPVFQFLLNGLQTKELSQMAAVSFSKMAHHNSQYMGHMFPVLIEVSKAADSLSVELDSVIELLTGCALVLSHLPPASVTAGLFQLCHPHASPIYMIASSANQTDPVKYLDRLACIFRNVQVSVADSEEHPCKKVVEQLWDLFKKIAQKFKADDRIMERHFRCIRFAIRCLGKDFFHLMPALVELMVGIYLEHHHSCFLYLGSILADEYGKIKHVQESLMQMLRAFTTPTFQMLSEERGLINHPDTVDDFFRLCIRFLQKVTLPFLQNEAMDSIVQLATAATALDHREANMSVMKFFVELIKCTQIEQGKEDFNEVSQRVQLVQSLLGKYGHQIVRGFVAAVAGGIQVFMLPEVGDALWEMLRFYHQPSCLWLKDALSVLPSHGPTGTPFATNEQVSSFYKAVIEATSVKTIWREFREFHKFYK